MRLTFRDKTFLIYEATHGFRNLRNIGFTFDRAKNCWFTTDIRSAARLRAHADDAAKKEIYRKYISHTPWAGHVPTNPGNFPLPHQKPMIRFALERNRSYWWADMGVGKGPSSAIVINALASRAPQFVVYVCPPELTYNVEAELQKWLIRAPRIVLYKTGVPLVFDVSLINVLILPDTMLGKALIPQMSGRQSFLIVDEADRFKNPNAERTKNLFGYKVRGEGWTPGVADQFERVLYMTGTAMPNGSALEMFPVLNHSAPETIDFADYYKFAFKFCIGEKSRFGWKFHSIKNEDELRRRVYGTFLYRLEKDVLDLPERIESALVIAADMKPVLADLDRRLRKYSPEDLMRRVIHEERGGKKGAEDELHLMTYRRLLGRDKVKPLLPYIKSVLEKESLIIYAIHTEVVDLLAAGLRKFDPVVIDGRLKKRDRHDAIEQFKKDPRHRPVIANIHAFKRGFTVLKCRRGLFVEWDWVPGSNDQAGDRMHRIGQTKDVYLQYALFRNSVDMGVLEAIFRKRKNTLKMNTN